MLNAGDFAVSQAEELKDALDALTSNEFVMGDHHFTLQVLAELPEPARRRRQPGAEASQRSRGAGAQSSWPIPGMTVAREDLALEAAFWAQLPGNFALRPRKAPITSRNFAAMAPFHNYPVGRADRQSLGRGAGAAVHERALAVLLLAARERSRRIPTAAAARTPGTPSSAVPRAPARPSSSAFCVTHALARRAPRR